MLPPTSEAPLIDVFIPILQGMHEMYLFAQATR